jgi:hypothetical protein
MGAPAREGAPDSGALPALQWIIGAAQPARPRHLSIGTRTRARERRADPDRFTSDARQCDPTPPEPKESFHGK